MWPARKQLSWYFCSQHKLFLSYIFKYSNAYLIRSDKKLVKEKLNPQDYFKNNLQSWSLRKNFTPSVYYALRYYLTLVQRCMISKTFKNKASRIWRWASINFWWCFKSSDSQSWTLQRSLKPHEKGSAVSLEISYIKMKDNKIQ